MKKTNIYYRLIWLLVVFVTISACSDDDDGDGMMEEPRPELVSGSADFSTYVAVGNSLTAGYTDGALFMAAQQNSLPNILAQQFSLVGGGTFTQPLTNDNIGGLLIQGQPTSIGSRFFFDGVGPVRLDATPTTEVLNTLSGPFNNLGAPGTKSFHILSDGYGNPANLSLGLANPYYVRFASAPNASILGDALSQNPTFFSLWLGNQDVFDFAFNGGDEDVASITDTPTFTFAINTAIDALVATGAGGVVANVIDVNTLPHFTTVPFNPLDPTNPAFGPQIPLLNTIYGAINDVYAFLAATTELDVEGRNIQFSDSAASAVVIRDETLLDLSAQIAQVLAASPTFPAFVQSFGLPAEAAPLVAQLLGLTYGQSRQATEEDLLTLSSSGIIGTVNTDQLQFLISQGLTAELAGQFSVEGISLPLADKWVLLPSEQAAINAAVSDYNTAILSAADQAGIAHVDINALMTQAVSTGISDGDFTLTTDLVTGGLISLDGIHPTSRGYALVANAFLKAIDATYGSNFEASGNLVDIGDYPTNYPATLQ